MFGFSWFKLIAAGLAALAIVGVIYAGYTYISDLQELNRQLAADNATLEANVATLKGAIEDQKAAIASMEADNALKDSILTDTLEKFSDARQRTIALEERLQKHELGFLAANKPVLISKIINEATDSIGRCFEIASGSALTVEEVSATKKSEINTECPELANPNYKE